MKNQENCEVRWLRTLAPEIGPKSFRTFEKQAQVISRREMGQEQLLKCAKMKNAHAKHAKALFVIVKYANL